MRFKILGTEIYISFLFSALVSAFILADKTGLAVPTLVFAVLHELGHLFLMWICDSEPKSIKLVPASISITRGFSRKKYGDLIISIGGPIINLFLFFSFYINFKVTENKFSYYCALINFALFCFNMLPVLGLDGGNILKFILNKRFNDTYKSERIVRIITVLIGMLLLVLGITLVINGKTNISVFIVSVYILFSAFVRV